MDVECPIMAVRMPDRFDNIMSWSLAAVVVFALACGPAGAARPLLPPAAVDAADERSEHDYSLRLDPSGYAAPRPPHRRPLLGSGGLGAFMSGTLLRARGRLLDAGPIEITSDRADRMRLSRHVRMRVGRTTALQDGGIGGQQHALSPPDGHLNSYRETGEDGSAAIDLYDLSLSYEAFSPGPVSLSFIGGMRAIRAEVGQTRVETTPGGRVVSTLDQDHDIVPIPVVGTGVRWDVWRGVYLSGTASTHAISDRGTFVDLTAQTGIQLRPNIGLTAGYQRVRSGFDVRELRAELDEEGIFARIQIRF